MTSDFSVTVGAGSMRDTAPDAVSFAHQWTDQGVTVSTKFTGAHLLHLSVAGCVLNDLYREAATLGLALDGARVRAAGGFDTTTWRSTGIHYSIEVDCSADAAEVDDLIRVVEEVAEIPRVLRQPAGVERAR